MLDPLSLGLRRQGSRWWAGPCPFCGGKDRFVLKETQEGYVWFCRGCGDGRYHDVIDFLMKQEGIGYREALQRLKDRPELPQARTVGIGLPPDKWQQKAGRLVAQARQRLGPDTPAGRYLLARGIDSATWQAWELGEAVRLDPSTGQSRTALVIPNSLNGRLVGVKFRFLEGQGLRYIGLSGSLSLPFGCDHLKGSDPLLVVEGEINAISCWQAAGIDVVSTGAERPSTTALALLGRLAARYTRIAVWLDREERAKDLAKALKADICLRSPVVEGQKLEANGLLQRGLLANFVRQALGLPLPPVADDGWRSLAVCPECGGPLRRISRWEWKGRKDYACMACNAEFYAYKADG
jgi:hypothetical protein